MTITSFKDMQHLCRFQKPFIPYKDSKDRGIHHIRHLKMIILSFKDSNEVWMHHKIA